jgi:hypothetical protein
MSSVRTPPRGRAWLRALVLLLAVLMPGAPAEASTSPVCAAESAEYDSGDTALRPPQRAAHRALAPSRPTPRTAPARRPGLPGDRALTAPPRTPYAAPAPHPLTVILRC